MATTRRPRSDIKADSALVAELDSLKGELGTISRTMTIRRLLQEHEAHKREGKKGELPQISSAVMNDSTPVILAGPTGAGKTFQIRRLLEGYQGNIFALDVSGEYPDLQGVDIGRFFSYPWADGGRIRVVPTNELSATVEAESILQQLVVLMRQEARPLAKWTIIVEEGDRFARNPNLRILLGEGRKFTSKVFVAIQRWNTFKDIAPAYRPAPRLTS